MSIATVVTRGFGSFGTVNYTVTRGYDGTIGDPQVIFHIPGVSRITKPIETSRITMPLIPSRITKA